NETNRATESIDPSDAGFDVDNDGSFVRAAVDPDRAVATGVARGWPMPGTARTVDRSRDAAARASRGRFGVMVVSPGGYRPPSSIGRRCVGAPGRFSRWR